MRKRPGLNPEQRQRRLQEAVAFLRDWLPEDAKSTYREMMRDDPQNWMRHPHFASGVIARHALRGNGIDERALGVESLDEVWPELLRAAIAEVDDDSNEPP